MTRYENSPILKSSQGYPYIKGRVYPIIPLSETDVYVITTIGDRLDLLAYQYYNDSTLWWVISMINNNITKGFMFPEPGTQLRIPTDLNSVIQLYNEFNTAR